PVLSRRERDWTAGARQRPRPGAGAAVHRGAWRPRDGVDASRRRQRLHHSSARARTRWRSRQRRCITCRASSTLLNVAPGARRLLLVEAEPGLVMTLSDRLRAEGYELDTAS